MEYVVSPRRILLEMQRTNVGSFLPSLRLIDIHTKFYSYGKDLLLRLAFVIF
jgi:hypothetical protein